MSEPLVSIIMPAYNAEPYIEQAVNSILNQTYNNIELLICDDGSTDQTANIIRSIRDSRVKKFFNKKNIGNLKTSNFLFGQCSGEFVGIQDADDWSSSNRIRLSLEAFSRNPNLGIVGTNYMKTDALGNEVSCGLVPKTNKSIQQRMRSEVPPLLCASILVRKEIADQIGYYRPFFNRKGYADFDWIYRICEVTEASNIPETLYFYRKQSQSFTALNNKEEGIWSGYFMHKALVYAHHQRLRAQSDIFESKNRSYYKRFISQVLKRQGEQKFWKGDKRASLIDLLKSIKIDPFHVNGWKTLIFVARN